MTCGCGTETIDLMGGGGAEAAILAGAIGTVDLAFTGGVAGEGDSTSSASESDPWIKRNTHQDKL